MKKLYTLKAPNGTWLVLKEGSPDKLIAVRETKKAADAARRQFEAGESVFVTALK